MCAESENLQDNIEQCIHAVAPPKKNTGVWGGVRMHVCVRHRERLREREGLGTERTFLDQYS